MSDASPPPLPPQRSAGAQQPLIGIEEFTMIQNQLVQEKTAKYDALEQVRRLQIGLLHSSVSVVGILDHLRRSL